MITREQQRVAVIIGLVILLIASWIFMIVHVLKKETCKPEIITIEQPTIVKVYQPLLICGKEIIYVKSNTSNSTGGT